MWPSAVQLVPFGWSAESHAFTGEPPVTATFLMAPSDRNLTHPSSAEKNGLFASVSSTA